MFGLVKIDVFSEATTRDFVLESRVSEILFSHLEYKGNEFDSIVWKW